MLTSWYVLSLKPKWKGDCKKLTHLSSVSCLFIFFKLVDKFGSYIFFQPAELQFYKVNDHYFWNGDKEMCQIRLFHFIKELTKPSLKGLASLSSILQSTINFSSSYNKNQIRWSSSISLLLIIENCLPFTNDVIVVLVHKCVQQTHLLALRLETLGYIPRLLNA